MSENNITLIGMPGCGKSTAGVLLAKAINYDFLDSDLLIQTRQKMKLQEIIDTYGIERFNEIENSVNQSITVSETVIATGGSVIYGREAMEHLKEISTILYLKLSCEEIGRRLSNIKTRGISIRKGETLEQLYQERIPLYEKYADITIDCNHLDIEETVERMVKAVRIGV